ncbi:MAG: hypothetical protein IVW56_09445 [Candidatus Binataceae bacterium]|nr:hypothetical protein [Candidatus Binataceae bacterium]
MALLIKDANSAVQTIATQSDAQSNLVPEHVEAALVGGVATPVSSSAPMPVINAAAAPASDGSGTITAGGSAQTLFGGAVPTNGYLVANLDLTHPLYVCDVGVATAGGASIPVAAGAIFVTPDGYHPAGAVSLYGGTTGQAFAARRW